jgi:hypothetical protein
MEPEHNKFSGRYSKKECRNSREPAPRSLQQWGDFYRSELVERGFGKGNSNLNQELLQEAYASHFEPIISLLPSADPNL